jgi:hypothetical protein
VPLGPPTDSTATPRCNREHPPCSARPSPACSHPPWCIASRGQNTPAVRGRHAAQETCVAVHGLHAGGSVPAASGSVIADSETNAWRDPSSICRNARRVRILLRPSWRRRERGPAGRSRLSRRLCHVLSRLWPRAGTGPRSRLGHPELVVSSLSGYDRVPCHHLCAACRDGTLHAEPWAQD